MVRDVCSKEEQQDSHCQIQALSYNKGIYTQKPAPKPQLQTSNTHHSPSSTRIYCTPASFSALSSSCAYAYREYRLIAAPL